MQDSAGKEVILLPYVNINTNLLIELGIYNIIDDDVYVKSIIYSRVIPARIPIDNIMENYIIRDVSGFDFSIELVHENYKSAEVISAILVSHDELYHYKFNGDINFIQVSQL